MQQEQLNARQSNPSYPQSVKATPLPPHFFTHDFKFHRIYNPQNFIPKNFKNAHGICSIFAIIEATMGGTSSLKRLPKKPPVAKKNGAKKNDGKKNDGKQKTSWRHYVAMTTPMFI